VLPARTFTCTCHTPPCCPQSPHLPHPTPRTCPRSPAAAHAGRNRWTGRRRWPARCRCTPGAGAPAGQPQSLQLVRSVETRAVSCAVKHLWKLAAGRAHQVQALQLGSRNLCSSWRGPCEVEHPRNSYGLCKRSGGGCAEWQEEGSLGAREHTSWQEGPDPAGRARWQRAAAAQLRALQCSSAHLPPPGAE